jgi:hypothetical protein
MTRITIEYLIKGQTDFVKREIPVEEYFDLDEGEILEIDSCPNYLTLHEYTGVNLTELIFVYLCVEVDSKKIIIKQTYWDNGECDFSERIDIDEFGKETYRELILSVGIRQNGLSYEVLRLSPLVNLNFIVPNSHVLMGETEELVHTFDTKIFDKMLGYDS